MPTDSWTTRVWREFRAGNVTRAHRDTLLTLATYRGRGGTCTPAHATLAERARCSVRTVFRALEQARRLGLVSWAERRVRAGWRWLRTSNCYRLAVPATAVQPGMRPVRRPSLILPATSGHFARGVESKVRKSEQLASMLKEAAAMPDLLAQRRAAFERGLVS